MKAIQATPKVLKKIWNEQEFLNLMVSGKSCISWTTLNSSQNKKRQKRTWKPERDLDSEDELGWPKNFILNIRFAQLDVRPALDSAEAVQDRMKVSSDQENSHNKSIIRPVSFIPDILSLFLYVPGCLVEVQSRVAGHHATKSGGKSVVAYTPSIVSLTGWAVASCQWGPQLSPVP